MLQLYLHKTSNHEGWTRQLEEEGHVGAAAVAPVRRRLGGVRGAALGLLRRVDLPLERSVPLAGSSADFGYRYRFVVGCDDPF